MALAIGMIATTDLCLKGVRHPVKHRDAFPSSDLAADMEGSSWNIARTLDTQKRRYGSE
jgi:hypothetical protein